MVDLHCHILPGIDDGAATMDHAVSLAAAAEAAGIDTVVATPHIRDDHPFPIEQIPERVDEVQAALDDAGVRLEVMSGGEVSLSKVTELDDDELAPLCLGNGRYLLVESPYATAPSLLEMALSDLQVRGFKPVLAHPERSMSFLNDRVRLERLVEAGVMCSVTAGSVAGDFGNAVRNFTMRMFGSGLVHNIASDAHDATRRAPGFERAFEQMEHALEGAGYGAARWFADGGPRAIVEGGELSAVPTLSLRPSGWMRMKERVRLA